MAAGWRPGGEKVATYVTYVRDDTDGRSVANATGAERLFGRRAVAEYVTARRDAGLSTDVRSRAICGKYAKALLGGARWDEATILAAVRAFAATKRSPRYLEEWAGEWLVARELAAHLARKAESARNAPRTGGFRSLGAAIDTYLTERPALAGEARP